MDNKSIYTFPPLSLLKHLPKDKLSERAHYLRESAQRINQLFINMGIDVCITNICEGPISTRYEFELNYGAQLAKVKGCAPDIALVLRCEKVTIAPVEGKCAVIGIDVPRNSGKEVSLRDVLETSGIARNQLKYTFALGKDAIGNNIICDLNKERHLLIGGTTGSGKSTMIHSLIISLLYSSSPIEVKFVMVDTKSLELSQYQGIPHLLIPVVMDEKKAIGAMSWLEIEMKRRYSLFFEMGARNLEDYNSRAAENKMDALPSIVAIVDDVFQLLSYKNDSAEDILRNLIQKAHSVGIHLILVTQYVQTSAIAKISNIQNMGRIAFRLPGRYDSIALLGQDGAEQLAGEGQMLYLPLGQRTPCIVQGCFVSDEEMEAVISYVVNSERHYTQSSLTDVTQSAQYTLNTTTASWGQSQTIDDKYDVYLKDAMESVLESGKASIGMLQRTFKIGFNRAARIMDQMEELGFVGPESGTKPRVILGDSVSPYFEKTVKKEENVEESKKQDEKLSSVVTDDEAIFDDWFAESEVIVITPKNELKKSGFDTLKNVLGEVFRKKH